MVVPLHGAVFSLTKLTTDKRASPGILFAENPFYADIYEEYI